jgi:farnesol dehydrogenase
VCLWKLWIEGISIQAMCGLAGLQSQVNVQGLRNVIDAVKANPSVKKLVYTSSFFALGYTDGHIGDEDQVHPGKFISPYEESKFLADKVAQEAAAEGVPIVSVYPGMVYGPGKLTAGNSLALMVMFQIYQSFLEAQ